jgi:hypothetical protein
MIHNPYTLHASLLAILVVLLLALMLVFIKTSLCVWCHPYHCGGSRPVGPLYGRQSPIQCTVSKMQRPLAPSRILIPHFSTGRLSTLTTFIGHLT